MNFQTMHHHWIWSWIHVVLIAKFKSIIILHSFLFVFGFNLMKILVLGQLPTGDNSPPDKNKAKLHVLPTTIPTCRTTPPLGQHYQRVKPIIRANIYMMGNCPVGNERPLWQKKRHVHLHSLTDSVKLSSGVQNWDRGWTFCQNLRSSFEKNS